MKLGIVGLPNVGKTIDPNVGIVPVPDERLRLLAEFSHSKKVTPATVEFVDIAGLVKGASKGEGLGNQFLANIRECDAIVHVVRCFEDDNIIHVDGKIDPVRDIETITLELTFADLEVLERRIGRTAKTAKAGASKDAKKEYEWLLELKKHLEDGEQAITVDLGDDEANAFKKSLCLLTDKPVIYAANVAEEDLGDDGASNANVQKVRELAKAQGAEVFVISAAIEQEIAELDEDEKAEFLADLGVERSGLDKLIAASYKILGLMSFLTTGEDETRAWTIPVNCKAPKAAGKIHTDFERGFIKAEVINYQELLAAGSYAAAREKGLIRIEGKEYIVRDGDVILFRFNVLNGSSQGFCLCSEVVWTIILISRIWEFSWSMSERTS